MSARDGAAPLLLGGFPKNVTQRFNPFREQHPIEPQRVETLLTLGGKLSLEIRSGKGIAAHLCTKYVKRCKQQNPEPGR